MDFGKILESKEPVSKETQEKEAKEQQQPQEPKEAKKEPVSQSERLAALKQRMQSSKKVLGGESSSIVTKIEWSISYD